MTLQEIFDQLSAGEFSQLSIGRADQGVIDETNFRNVIGHINLGLTALYTRFNLKQRQLKFPIRPESSSYQINLPDLLKIEKVFVDSGVELPLNQEGEIYGCTTTSMNTLKVPNSILAPDSYTPDDIRTSNLLVVYRANHPKIILSSLFSGQPTPVELPSSHLTALLYFVASRVNNPIGMTNEFHAGNSYATKYELACQELEGQGLQIDQGATNTRLERNGWV